MFISFCGALTSELGSISGLQVVDYTFIWLNEAAGRFETTPIRSLCNTNNKRRLIFNLWEQRYGVSLDQDSDATADIPENLKAT